MKPPLFQYAAPATLAEAVQLLAEYGSEAKVLAGGQSLMPMLNMRLVRPSYLLDLNRVRELSYIRQEGEELVIGAMTRQRMVERSQLVQQRCPLLQQALSHVGHVQIRNRGTVGGSLAHADPAAELPAVAVALGATLVIAGPGNGRRKVSASSFFHGYFTTDLAPEELLVEIRFPVDPPGSRSAFVEVARRHGDFAICGVAVHVVMGAGGAVERLRLALAGVGLGPVAPRVGHLIGGRADEAWLDDAAAAARAACEPVSDLHASAEFRRHLAGILTRRALAAALDGCMNRRSVEGGPGGAD